ncbi:PREDICTED: uncharacterized protein LOC109475673 [Branchiostoma belcheri]|uniref:Uncharacterized protein LOC109475673 n=1 Tax=Branchiostoma belcheri TaxID=7741 RepID=A0A6P4Z5V4_BRABE|nr:PREDICTED: uncharacterized protein LOC109475673 [Branchiostoma belcheri]
MNRIMFLAILLVTLGSSSGRRAGSPGSERRRGCKEGRARKVFNMVLEVCDGKDWIPIAADIQEMENSLKKLNKDVRELEMGLVQNPPRGCSDVRTRYLQHTGEVPEEGYYHVRPNTDMYKVYCEFPESGASWTRVGLWDQSWEYDGEKENLTVSLLSDRDHKMIRESKFSKVSVNCDISLSFKADGVNNPTTLTALELQRKDNESRSVNVTIPAGDRESYTRVRLMRGSCTKFICQEKIGQPTQCGEGSLPAAGSTSPDLLLTHLQFLPEGRRRSSFSLHGTFYYALFE